MFKRWFALFAIVLGLPLSLAAQADTAVPPRPHDTAEARKAGRDAGPPPDPMRASAADLSTEAAGASFRVFATQYNPNTPGSVEVAIPDKCAKFAALGWTSTLASQNCPSGYRVDLDWRVLVQRESGERLMIGVKDVGPWNVDDNYWNAANGSRPRRTFADLPRGTPEAQAAFYDGYNTVPDCKTLSGSSSGHAGPADQFGRCVLNPAGIDLSVAAAAKLGLRHLQNEWVTVTFLWERISAQQSHVLWHNTGNGKVKRWIMSETVKERASRVVLPRGAGFPRQGWKPIDTGDFNGDGQPDVLWWKQDTDALVVWFMKGSRRIGRTRVDADGVTMGAGWRPVGVDDFDRDGRTDVAWHHSESGKVALWYLKRTTRQRSATIDPSGEAWPSGEWTPFAATDLNGNDQPDIAWHNSSTGRVMIWYLSGTDGNMRSSSTVVLRPAGTDWPSPPTWAPVGLGDFKGTDAPDIVWHNTSNGALDVWTMGGSEGSEASAATRVTTPSFPPPTKVPVVWQ